MGGPGLIVFDRHATEVEELEHYVVTDASGQCQLVDGGAASGADKVLGKVLFCCRPPTILLDSSKETSELIQL